jgi:formamidopyrimidine-DNA glycosylase
VPELPETETLARDLGAILTGRSIASVAVIRPDVLRNASVLAMRRRLSGAAIGRVWRRAKSVVMDLSTGDRLVVQPRFTGGLVLYEESPTPDVFSAIQFTLQGGGGFVYRDVRRLGTVALLRAGEFERWNNRLGVEPLDDDFTADRLSDFLRATTRAVKKVLMDQRLIAGVGNIYANEALWRSRIDPSRMGPRIDAAAVGRLRDDVVKVLGEAIDARGTTFRDFRDAYGERGGFVERLAVYGREGCPCRRCGTRLALTHAIDLRATVFCFRCQA